MIERRAEERVTEIGAKNIRAHGMIGEGGLVIVGFSGGPDSLCLLRVLKGLSVDMGFQIVAVHVNHMFRDVDAEQDAEYAERVCRKWGINCHVFKIDCKKIAEDMGISDEDAGRRVRYRAYYRVADFYMRRDVCEDYICESEYLPGVTRETIARGEENRLELGGLKKEDIAIAVGQNRGDQVETLMFRILRGTGTDGLAGMEYSREGGGGYRVIRPLLNVSREEIDKYCLDCELNPRIDHTNSQTNYTRNKIRLQLLPFIREEFGVDIEASLCRLRDVAAEDKSFLWEEAEKSYEEALVGRRAGRIKLELKKMQAMHRAVRHRVLLAAFRDIGLDSDISRVNLLDGDKLIEEGVTSKRIDFPRGYSMRTSYDLLEILSTDDGRESFNIEEPKLKIHLMDEEPRGDYRGRMVVLDFDNLAKSFGNIETLADVRRLMVIRRRIPGDYMTFPFGRKKLQNFLVDRKVPVEERAKMYLVTIGNEILWIPELEGEEKAGEVVSSKYQVTEGTERWLAVEIVCES